jgi:recombination protein RecA
MSSAAVRVLDFSRAQAILADSELGVRRASTLERPSPEMVSTGVPAIDALTGGLPRGALTEIVGPTSSGRTSLLLSLLAQATARQEACALVDASDAFDPESAVAAGIDLKRLLWVRCRVSDRVLDRVSGRVPDPCEARAGKKNGKHDPGAHVEQALKTADLLLQSGGFGVVVLDLSDVPPAIARRVPLTSWFRFRRAVENTPTVLLALEQQAYAKAAASLVLGLQRCNCHWKAIADRAGPSHTCLLGEIEIEAEVLRSQIAIKKSPASAHAHYFLPSAWSIRI